MKVERTTTPNTGDYVRFEDLVAGDTFYVSDRPGMFCSNLRLKLDDEKYCDPNDGELMYSRLPNKLFLRAKAKIVIED